MAALANGGSADDLAPGVDYFKQLNDAGNLIPVDVTPATIESGQTPVVMDWDYLNAAETKALPSWKVVVPDDAVVGGFYFQAINKDAPHPNAARLWEEFLYSDEGQNLWLAGGARPIRADAMAEAGTIDQAAYRALPPVNGTPVVPDGRPSDGSCRSTWSTTGQTPSADVAFDDNGSGRASGSPRSWSMCHVFLFIPTIVVFVNAFVQRRRSSRWARSRRSSPRTSSTRPRATVSLSLDHRAHRRAWSGPLIAYVVLDGRPDGMLRKAGHQPVGCSPSSVASRSLSRSSRRSAARASSAAGCRTSTSTSPTAPGCSRVTGLKLVYTYFQMPLMVIVFLPALDGIRPQWREAADNLGASHLAVLAACGHSAPDCRRSWARCCCCSPTPSRPTRRRRH